MRGSAADGRSKTTPTEAHTHTHTGEIVRAGICAHVIVIAGNFPRIFFLLAISYYETPF